MLQAKDALVMTTKASELYRIEQSIKDNAEHGEDHVVVYNVKGENGVMDYLKKELENAGYSTIADENNITILWEKPNQTS